MGHPSHPCRVLAGRARQRLSAMLVPVSDPFSVTADPKMPFLAMALDPLEAQSRLRQALPAVNREPRAIYLRAVRVVRHKPGRRCLIEYDVVCEESGRRSRALSLIGKVRARGFDETSYRLNNSLMRSGFGPDCSDAVMVPEPAGKIPELRMWLQHKVPGTVSTELIANPEGVQVARRIADAIHKLHAAGIATHRRHTLADELRILHERLELVMQARPQWRARLRRLLASCERLGASIDTWRTCGIHRDFYPDQVLVNNDSLYLLDLDLYCQGDPALDIGNFIGHLTEQALRTFDDPAALSDQEAAIEGRFLELNDNQKQSDVQAYSTLTLARHIHISTRFADRQLFTERLIDLCEQRISKQVLHPSRSTVIPVSLSPGKPSLTTQ